MVDSYAWGAQGGILNGAADLSRAFLAYPALLAGARQRQQSLDLQTAEAAERRRRGRIEDAFTTGIVPPGTEDLDVLGNSLYAPYAAEGARRRSLTDQSLQQQIEAANQRELLARRGGIEAGFLEPEVAQGSEWDEIFGAQPSFEEGLAQQGADVRAAKADYMAAQAESLRRPRASEFLQPDERALALQRLRKAYPFSPPTQFKNPDFATALLHPNIMPGDPEFEGMRKGFIDANRGSYQRDRATYSDAMRGLVSPEALQQEMQQLDALYGVQPPAQPAAQPSVAPATQPTGYVPAPSPTMTNTLATQAQKTNAAAPYIRDVLALHDSGDSQGALAALQKLAAQDPGLAEEVRRQLVAVAQMRQGGAAARQLVPSPRQAEAMPVSAAFSDEGLPRGTMQGD